MKLSRFEKFVIDSIFAAEAPEFIPAVPDIVVKSREHNGSGFYVNLNLNRERICETNKKATLGTSAYADVDGMKYGVGFMLYVDDGIPTLLEVFSHGSEEIPMEIKEFQFKFL